MEYFLYEIWGPAVETLPVVALSIFIGWKVVNSIAKERLSVPTLYVVSAVVSCGIFAALMSAWQ